MLQAVAEADAIVIGPSNPVISIGPILALPGMREALRAAPAPVVAVSPFVDGRAVKGPTEPFCEHAGIALSADGIARAYGEVLDGIVADERVDELPGARHRHAHGRSGGPARGSHARCSSWPRPCGR